MSTGGGTINFGLSADGRRLENALARSEDKIRKLTNAMARLKDESKRSAVQGSTSWEKFAGTLGATLGKLYLVEKAFGLISGHVREQARLSEQAAKGQATLGESQQQYITMTGAVSTQAQRQGTYVRLAGMVGKDVKQFTENELTQAMRAAMQAQTETDYAKREAVGLALMKNLDVYTGQKDQVPALMEAIPGVARSLGLERPGMSGKTEEILAVTQSYLLRLLGQSALKGPEGLSGFQKMAGSLDTRDIDDEIAASVDEKIKARYRSMATAGALFTAIGQRQGEPYGEETATAGSGLVSGLEKFFEKKRLTIGGKTPQTTEARLMALISGEGLDKGQSVEQVLRLTKSFMGETNDPKMIKSREKMMGSIKELLQGGPTQELFLSEMRAIPEYRDMASGLLLKKMKEAQAGETSQVALAAETKRLQASEEVQQKYRAMRGFVESKVYGADGAMARTSDNFMESFNAWGMRIIGGMARQSEESAYQHAYNVLTSKLKFGSITDDQRQALQDTLDSMTRLQQSQRSTTAGQAANTRGQTEAN